jgi:hypothetical protein
MIPDNPKIFHIVHISKLPAIVAEKSLLSDAEVQKHAPSGVTIGMRSIKERRLTLYLRSQPDLCVGNCVPFYFCPRSVMLYMFYKANHPEIEYRGGQESIVHLVADLKKTIRWANLQGLRWAFTTSNAGSRYFEDYKDLRDLSKIDWLTVLSNDWHDKREAKQAEFLIERRCSWELIEEIGVYSFEEQSKVSSMLAGAQNRAPVRIRRAWYY